MIIDGHTHIYPQENAEKIVRSFTELHRMEPTGSIGAGTAEDLSKKMDTVGIDYAVGSVTEKQKVVQIQFNLKSSGKLILKASGTFFNLYKPSAYPAIIPIE
ncbi:MAG: hypothetical protein J6066_00295 [Lachnospiraceae bacterium]|nr:hypothetical protein [Lachnospiraceae bacterium]